jgi:methylmalonyl-CoA/ethylmalonyl-CoA epimerase
MSAELEKNVYPAEDLKLHHVGFVVRSIEDCGLSFAQALGATWDGKITFDPIQKVQVTFFEGRSSTDPLIELVEPAADDSPVIRFLERGGGLHHLCYEVNDLEEHLEFCKSVGNTIIRPPAPAVAFDGRRIAWVATRKKLLLEFLERKDVAGQNSREKICLESSPKN